MNFIAGGPSRQMVLVPVTGFLGSLTWSVKLVVIDLN